MPRILNLTKSPAQQPACHQPVCRLSARHAKLALLLGSMLFTGACSYLPSLQFPGVYKIDIQQGNIITQEMVDQLRPGMTKRQVTFVMGTPLVRDPFNQDRWDYVYSYQPGGGVRGQERITMYFENDLLVNFTGDFRPGDGTTADSAPATTPDAEDAPAASAAPAASNS